MKNFLIVVLMLAIIAGTGYGVYYQVDNHNKKNETSTEEQKKEETAEKEIGESIDVKSDIVMTLMNKLSIINDTIDSDEITGYFYKEEKYTVDNISNNVKMVLAANQIYLKKTLGNDSIGSETFTVTKEEMKNEVENIFGSDTSYDDSKIEIQCKSEITYDENNKMYTFNNFNGCGGMLLPYITTNIESATKYSDRLEIVEKVAYIKYTEETNGITKNVYKNTVDKTVVGTLKENEDVFTLYKDSLNNYKYTFNYENGNYYLSSVELVK